MQPPIHPEPEMVSASDLREFVFCERAWFLTRSGVQQSAPARARMDSGTVYHQQRTAAIQKAADPMLARWALGLLAIVIMGLLILWVLW